jgi:hypothetical protein
MLRSGTKIKSTLPHSKKVATATRKSEQSCAFNEGMKSGEQKEEGIYLVGRRLICPTDNKRHLLSSRFSNFAPIAKHANFRMQT